MLLEKEAERGRAELAACLEEAAAGEMRVFEDAKSAGVLERLRLERSTQEVRRVAGEGLSRSSESSGYA